MKGKGESNVGGGLPPMAVYQSQVSWLTYRYRGVAIHNSAAPNRNHDAKRAALDLDLLVISGAPLNHAGRTQA
ncbi:hypothetical protein CUU62_18825 [Pseudomonas sp. WP001]|nr:hypothetical protein CUU62_18825 [Pseudomonas sp. WP001]